MSRRILIYRIGSIGDTAVALPAFRLVAQTFPDAERRVLTNIPVNTKAAPLEAVLKNTGLVHGYMAYPLRTRNFHKLVKLRGEICTWRPDTLIYLTPPRGLFKAFRDMLFFRSCGIKKLIGVPLKRDLQQSRQLDGGHFYEHEASRLGRCISTLGEIELDDSQGWQLGLTAQERSKARDVLMAWEGTASFAAVSIGTKADVNDWGSNNWKALFDQLSRRYPDLGLVLIGSPDEADTSAETGHAWQGPVLNLCGGLSPRESAAVLEQASLFMGHDSGPMHLAASVGTPCVAVFSARNKPGEWFPYGKQHRIIYHQMPCFGCRLVVCEKHGKKCIYSIEVSEVLAAVEEILAGTKLKKLVFDPAPIELVK
ncbi:glycosyl transferase family 9 [Nitrosococcus halophilus Nc 4]|uniref:Glycosyl transferase family 9 n=1 Tax=Nitrosococcus halophilus (strain Nc4) TaxID=472759 RepID=D5C0F3_NITHN|nr:glycosyltransferase family 9 protein [Nitrosococcus halophilus]ADE14479.1 glycosyl transferase family 9 [Nitrosococcus halophilus Nc 4]